MRIGYLQFAPVFGAKQDNLNRVGDWLSGVKADLVVLPELFTTGYIFESREELLSLAEDTDGESFKFLKTLSAATGTALVAGLPERAGDVCFNSCFFFSEGEIRARYRKTHLFKAEKDIFQAGTGPFDVMEFKGARIGMMICFDWIFPEVTRLLALKGVQVVCHPSNLVLPYCPQAMITRSIENGVFTVTVNRVGTERRGGMELEFIGMSQIIGPRGHVLVRAGKLEEGLRVIEIDPSLADDKMVTDRNHLITDRKPALYGGLCAEPPESGSPGGEKRPG